jgi:hypothetical protein
MNVRSARRRPAMPGRHRPKHTRPNPICRPAARPHPPPPQKGHVYP